ncbi:unnamed protein product [Fraxinus pennsylvanica]|uniref:GDSL esterase/lipase n=1 Tax=Fraxinus pennsylvanica TaxID=56036 RepID=A0AAD1Z6K1_9LAMI|nr:unnamed protein product [Fraxinus pennsylvanica]
MSKFCIPSKPCLMICIVLMALLGPMSDAKKCPFEAIFNFGDSNTDTGGFWAAFPTERLPFGMTYFKRPSGRATDGRVIIDFLAQGLGQPFVSPYLQSIGSDYRHGANFATLASTVLLPNTSLFVTGVSPFSLAIQLNQMKHFKVKVDELHYSGKTNLPPPDIFRKSLYTFYIGQNDFTGNLASIGIRGVKKYLPQVISQIASTIKEIYALGGRTFLVLNLAPIEYNSMLKEAMKKTRKDLPKAEVIYVDIHTVMLKLFQHPTSHGMTYGTKACCGEGGGAYNFNPQVYCGNSKVIDGHTLNATACSDPHNYVSWDGIHATEAANKLVAYAILNGSYSHPAFSLYNYCDIHPFT